MKKNYLTPKSLVTDIKFDEIMLTGSIQITDEDADPALGADAKARIVDFSDEDMF